MAFCDLFTFGVIPSSRADVQDCGGDQGRGGLEMRRGDGSRSSSVPGSVA